MVAPREAFIYYLFQKIQHCAEIISRSFQFVSIRQIGVLYLGSRKYIPWRQGGKEDEMDKKSAENQNEIQRERLISFIIKAIDHLGVRELDLVVRFIKSLTE